MTTWSCSRRSTWRAIASTTSPRSWARRTWPTCRLTAVVGISKIARVVEIFAKRLQTQETMTAQVAHAIDDRAEAAAAWLC